MEQFTEQLVDIAFRSFLHRRTAGLENPARLLIRLNAPYDSIGKYFLGVYLTRSGEHIQALGLLEQAALAAPPAYQARAIACMASMANSEGDLESARVLANEALKAAIWPGGQDDFTRLGALQVLAINKVRRGESRSALVDFLDLLPETAAFSKQYEPLYLNLLNSIAVEFMAIGRLDDAIQLSARTVESAYCWREWRDTWNDLQARKEMSGLSHRFLSSSGRRLTGTGDIDPQPNRNEGSPTAGTALNGKLQPHRLSPELSNVLANQTRRGKLEVIAGLLRQELTSQQSDAIIDLLDGLWFHTGTWT